MARLLWKTCYPPTASAPPVPARPSPPAGTFCPMVAASSEVAGPPPAPNPFEWTVVERGRKRSHPVELEQTCVSAKRSQNPKGDQQQMAVLDACSIPPSHVRSRHAVLLQDAIDEAVLKGKKVDTVPSTRHAPRSIDADSDACVCSNKLQMAVVAGDDVRVASSPADQNESLVCSVVAAIKHLIAPVCTWKSNDVDGIRIEGRKLVTCVESRTTELCKFIELHNVFGRKWNVDIGDSVYGGDDATEVHKCMEEHLNRDGMCLLTINGAVSSIIKHTDFFVVVDCGARNASGLQSKVGSSVAVFNTCFQDLICHLQSLKRSLGVDWHGISSISVKEAQVDPDTDPDTESATVLTDGVYMDDAAEVGSSVRPVNSVRGSFHQGSDLFTYQGVQCMAIALVSLATHNVASVFSWETKDLDNVLLLGDQLYTHLRTNNMISHPSNLLCVTDLPKESVLHEQKFQFEHGDYVTGDVDVDEGKCIEAGVYTSLVSGLQKILSRYNTCLLTVCGSTCAIICEGGQYALVDSHARSASGMVKGNGSSVVMYFGSINDLVNHICHLAAGLSRKRKLFEVAGVCVAVQSSLPAGQTATRTESVQTLAPDELSLGTLQSVAGPVAEPDQTFANNELSCGSPQDEKTKVSSASRKLAETSVENATCFSPLCEHVSRRLCAKLNVEFQNTHLPAASCVGLLGVPCKNETTEADGNSFFRAISQAVSGTQNNHRKVRLTVVKRLETNAVEYRSILRSEYCSMSEYINKSKMRRVHSWATELEIQAAADYLGVNIFTFCDGRWLKYSCKSNLLSKHSIYLQNYHGNHYETVVCVNQPEVHTCHGFCKINMYHSKGYNVRSRVKDGVNEQNNTQNNTEQHQMPLTLWKDTCCAAALELDCDVDVVDDAKQITDQFCPLSTEVAQTLCSKCNLEFEKHGIQVATVYGPLGAVCKTHAIVEDGNSYFRSISQVICGSQKGHLKVRRAVVKYMKNHSETVKFAGEEFASITDYIEESKMNYVDSRATEIEIQATANAFGLDMFINTGGKWLKYSTMSPKLSSDTIYLRLYDTGHFEPVLCVQPNNEQVCFNVCKLDSLPEAKYSFREKRADVSNVLNVEDPAQERGSRLFISKYLKKRTKFLKRMRYQKGLELLSLYLETT